MTDITIPPEALEAAAIADFAADHGMLLWLAEQRWAGMSATARERRIKRARAACLAMLKAWPGMEIEKVFVEETYLILPLPKES